jgi:cytochrome b6-f complex iron-sulfur subunit
VSKEKLTKKIDSCECDYQVIPDPSRRNFIKQATTLTIIGGTAFILEACGGGGSPTSSDDGTGGGSGGGDTGYNYDAATGTITIDITMIHTTLQSVGSGIALSGSITFDNKGIIVLRTSNTGVRALSRNCTHQGNAVNIDSTNNNLPCSAQTSGHGSVFDFSGNVVSGPATSSLTQYNASLSGTIITITAS